MSTPERDAGPQSATGGLSPEAAALVETYFTRVHGALLLAAAGECEDAVDDLRTHILEQLADTSGTPADVTRALADLGAPEALAAEYADASSDDEPSQRLSDVDTVPLHGRLLKVPFELRVPSSDRIAQRWWNPLDPRIFVPRVFGIGWDINFGAVAVKLHLVRPDDEDEPFASVPPRIISATMLFPVVLGIVFVGLVAATWAGLPAMLPAHWNVGGEADSFWARGWAIGFLAVMSLAPVAAAASTHLRRRAPLNRVAASAAATFLGTIAFSQLIQTLLYAGGTKTMVPTFVGIAAAFLVPFAMLVSLSRVGRAEEQRRDLEATSKKGSV